MRNLWITHANRIGWAALAAALSASWSCAPAPALQATAPQAAARERLQVVALDAPRHGHRIEHVDGGLLSFGGFGNPSVPDRETRQTFWLAPGAKQWQRRADMAVGRAFFSSATVDGIVYAIGEGIERYDRAADRWVEVLAPGTLPRSHFGAAAIGHTLYVLGGYGSEGADLLVVDLDGPTLRRESAPPGFGRGDHFHFVVALRGQLHVIGGLDGESFEPKTEHWLLSREGWKAQAAPPPGLWAKFALQCVVGDKLYLFGDFGGFCFDAATGQWSERAKLEGKIVMSQTLALDGVLWVIGGELVGAENKPQLRAYDLAQDAWRPAGG